ADMGNRRQDAHPRNPKNPFEPMRIYELTVGNKAYNVKVKSFSSHQAELEVNGKLMKVDVKAIGDDLVGKPVARAAAPSSTAPVRAAPVSAKKMPVAGAGAITA
ncbi:hypothetical protein, partial [Klebsiella pneumoniae]|uniref:hypothetical protein n=1 Tax=Klebsiella pneumoniae TaxID=573 RepID=UPI001C8F74AB